MKLNKFDRALYHVVYPIGKDGTLATNSQEHKDVSKEACKEGIVLLKNINKTLPLKRGTKIAIVGKAQFDFRKCGGGSGYVHTDSEINIYNGINGCEDLEIVDYLSDYYKEYFDEAVSKRVNSTDLIKEPSYPLDLVQKASKETDVCLITLVRYSTEDSDPVDDENNPYFGLSKEEKNMIELTKQYFSKVIVVINSGAIIDLSWAKDDEQISSVLYLWQPGQFGGEVLCDTLLGKNNPSGKLVDTIARSIDDYPSTKSFKESFDVIKYTEDVFVGYRYFETIDDAYSKVVYPFGYGLSYTSFEITNVEMFDNGEKVFCNCVVENTGSYDGKEVVQIYFEAPNSKISTPKKVLCAYAKTPLIESGKKATLFLDFDISSLASFDDEGVISKSAYVFEKGEYKFYIGTSIRDVSLAPYKYVVEKDTVVEQLSSHVGPTTLKERLLSNGTYKKVDDKPVQYETKEISYVNEYKPLEDEDKAKKLLDVYNEEISLDDFISQISTDDLITLLSGKKTQSVSTTYGMGGLDKFGIPLIYTCDGPAGVRMDGRCCIRTTCFPCATMLACTWNTDLVTQVGVCGAKEAKENNLQIWLTPALNIHRSPLCGRNFEYYSEDPLIAGTMAAAMVNGIQSEYVVACPKHFACNNKEKNRYELDTILSERALREIYLKGFEICVKQASPKLIMTAYNTINGMRCAENVGLLYGILRDEWGYKGCITTDWSNHANAALQVLAGNDINMPRPRPDRIIEILNEGKINRNMIALCVKRLLEMILFVE